MVPNMWFHTNINGRKGTNYVSIGHWLFIDCSLMIHWSWINYWYPLILFNIHISIPHIFPYGGRDSQRYFKLRSADPWAKNAIPGLWKIPWIDFNKWLIAPKTLWGDPPSGRVFFPEIPWCPLFLVGSFKSNSPFLQFDHGTCVLVWRQGDETSRGQGCEGTELVKSIWFASKWLGMVKRQRCYTLW